MGLVVVKGYHYIHWICVSHWKHRPEILLKVSTKDSISFSAVLYYSPVYNEAFCCEGHRVTFLYDTDTHLIIRQTSVNVKMLDMVTGEAREQPLLVRISID